jgi:small subunit ribosomal protein S6
MPQYELILVIDASIGQTQIDSILKSVEDQIKKANGEISKREPWGKKQLAYPINKVTEGVYHLLHLQFTNSNKVKSLESQLRLREDLLRYLIVRKQIKKSVKKNRKPSISPATKQKKSQPRQNQTNSTKE